MDLKPDLQRASFVRRDNRFLVTAILDGREVKAHLANSGRVRELLVPGAALYLALAAAPGRKTAFDVQLVESAGVLVSADARLPPHLLAERVLASPPDGLDGYDQVSIEVKLGESRIDLRLSAGAEKLYVETKSVTLVTDGVGLFPDAPTARGASTSWSSPRRWARG